MNYRGRGLRRRPRLQDQRLDWLELLSVPPASTRPPHSRRTGRGHKWTEPLSGESSEKKENWTSEGLELSFSSWDEAWECLVRLTFRGVHSIMRRIILSFKKMMVSRGAERGWNKVTHSESREFIWDKNSALSLMTIWIRIIILEMVFCSPRI